jgi:hypothetical protein
MPLPGQRKRREVFRTNVLNACIRPSIRASRFASIVAIYSRFMRDEK